jgi:hypothetical protein
MLEHIKGFVYAATQAYKSISTGLPNYVHRHRRIDRFEGPASAAILLGAHIGTPISPVQVAI